MGILEDSVANILQADRIALEVAKTLKKRKQFEFSLFQKIGAAIGTAVVLAAAITDILAKVIQ